MTRRLIESIHRKIRKLQLEFRVACACGTYDVLRLLCRSKWYFDRAKHRFDLHLADRHVFYRHDAQPRSSVSIAFV